MENWSRRNMKKKNQTFKASKLKWNEKTFIILITLSQHLDHLKLAF